MGKLKLSMMRFNIKEEVKEAIELMNIVAMKKNIQLHWEAADGVPE